MLPDGVVVRGVGWAVCAPLPRIFPLTLTPPPPIHHHQWKPCVAPRRGFTPETRCATSSGVAPLGDTLPLADCPAANIHPVHLAPSSLTVRVPPHHKRTLNNEERKSIFWAKCLFSLSILNTEQSKYIYSVNGKIPPRHQTSYLFQLVWNEWEKHTASSAETMTRKW